MGDKKRSIGEKLSLLLDIPEDSFSGAERIIIIGRSEVIVMSHKGLTEYTPERICIAASKCEVCVTGDDLDIKSLTQDAISVYGILHSVEFR